MDPPRHVEDKHAPGALADILQCMNRSVRDCYDVSGAGNTLLSIDVKGVGALQNAEDLVVFAARALQSGSDGAPRYRRAARRLPMFREALAPVGTRLGEKKLEEFAVSAVSGFENYITMKDILGQDQARIEARQSSMRCWTNTGLPDRLSLGRVGSPIRHAPDTTIAARRVGPGLYFFRLAVRSTLRNTPAARFSPVCARAP
jgi:hypothetical protein